MRMTAAVAMVMGVCGVVRAGAQRSEVKGIDADDRGKISVSAGNSPQAARDRLFLQNAAQGGMGEVELGKLAATKAANPEVKQFAQALVDDHTKMLEGLQPIAAKAQASLPKKLSKQDQAELGKLSGLSGPALDKEYLAYVDKAHTKDLKDFGDEQAATENAELRGVVAQDRATMSGHLAAEKKLAVAGNQQ